MTRGEWLVEAHDAAMTVARRNPTFTTEDVWEELEHRGVQLPVGVSARAMSGVMINLLKEGHTFRANVAPVPHRDARGIGRAPHAVRVWGSNLHQEAV